MKPLVEVDALLEAHPLFSRVSIDTRKLLVRQGTRVDLARGDALYEAGQSATEVYVILSGAIQIEYPSPDGKGFAAALLPAPAFVGEAQALHDRPWSGTGVALFPCIVLALKMAAFEAVFRSDPELSWSLYRELSWRFLGAIDAWKYHQSSTPEELLARYLVSYSIVQQKVLPRQPPQVEVNQNFLARATSLRRETVNRLLGRWENEGWLERTARALVGLDLAALRRLLPDGGKTLLLRSMYADRV
jgi:CRP-like cAMP-binding protein